MLAQEMHLSPVETGKLDGAEVELYVYMISAQRREERRRMDELKRKAGSHGR